MVYNARTLNTSGNYARPCSLSNKGVHTFLREGEEVKSEKFLFENDTQSTNIVLNHCLPYPQPFKSFISVIF